MRTLGGSILSSEQKLDTIKALLGAKLDFIHYDVMDGLFVPRNHLSLSELRELFKASAPHVKEVHLMVQDPEPWVKALIDQVDFMSVHLESLPPAALLRLLSTYQSHQKLGLAIKLTTPLSAFAPFALLASYVTLMSVEPGQGGQAFQVAVLERIKTLRQAYPQLRIMVDGGINLVSGRAALEAGADELIVGSALLSVIQKPAEVAAFKALVADPE